MAELVSGAVFVINCIRNQIKAFQTAIPAAQEIETRANHLIELIKDAKSCDSGDGRKLQTVAVVGADGRTGSEVVRELCHRGINDVIAGVRRYSRASSISALQSPEVKVIEIDLVQG